MALRPDGRWISVDAVAGQFFLMETVFEEHPLSVAERWEHIVQTAPWAARKPIYASFDDEFRLVYETGTINETFAAVDFAILRWHFFKMLLGMNVNLPHVNTHEMDVSGLWHRRLADRFDQLSDDFLEHEDQSSAALDLSIKHDWLH